MCFAKKSARPRARLIFWSTAIADLLPSSATGGGRSRVPLPTPCVAVSSFYSYQNKKAHLLVCFLVLSMGYKKDILGSFAYKFKLLQKMKSVQARMKSAMQMKLNPPIRRRGGFHPTKLDFIVADDFAHPQGWI